MTNAEKILAKLKQHPAGVCDDCLAKLADVTPRQQVNQICNDLALKHQILRFVDLCSTGSHRPKIVNKIGDVGFHPPPRLIEAVPSLAEQTYLLSTYLLEMKKIISSIDSSPSREFEPFPHTVARLTKLGTLSRDVGALMNTVNAYRNQVVKVGIALDLDHWSITERAMSIIRRSKLNIQTHKSDSTI